MCTVEGGVLLMIVDGKRCSIYPVIDWKRETVLCKGASGDNGLVRE